jgi:hypothetical protein
MRLEICIGLPQTPGMTDAIVKVLAEVLYVLAVATKEMKGNFASESIHGNRSAPLTHSPSEAFVKKLIGKTDLEDALLRLDAVIVEETFLVATQMTKDIYHIKKTLSGPQYKSKLW